MSALPAVLRATKSAAGLWLTERDAFPPRAAVDAVLAKNPHSRAVLAIDAEADGVNLDGAQRQSPNGATLPPADVELEASLSCLSLPCRVLPPRH